ncbi:hypothetical protein BDR06DRAFT_717446 [Suillus hirtellus]|nr:hypothetical protein BDR06DRAFT_717446 [Suillus hirtellus]
MLSISPARTSFPLIQTQLPMFWHEPRGRFRGAISAASWPWQLGLSIFLPGPSKGFQARHISNVMPLSLALRCLQVGSLESVLHDVSGLVHCRLTLILEVLQSMHCELRDLQLGASILPRSHSSGAFGLAISAGRTSCPTCATSQRQHMLET